MRLRPRKLLAAVGLAISFSQVVQAQECDEKRESARLDFVVQGMDGEDVRLSDYRGQVILLDFWATWCAPCRIEMPWFVEFYDMFRSEGFVVLALNVDDPAQAVQSFAAQYGMEFPVLVGADRDDFKDAYGPPVGYPTAFLIGRDGGICKSHTGFTAKETFEREIRALL